MTMLRALVRKDKFLSSPPSQDLAKLSEAIIREPNWVISVVPAQIPSLLAMLNQSKSSEQNTRHIIIGGVGLNDDIKELISLRKEHYWLSYGMTETASHIALMPISITAQQLLEGRNSSFRYAKGWYYVLGDARICTSPKGNLVINGEITKHQWLETTDAAETMVVGSQFFLRINGRLDWAINSGGVKILRELLESSIREWLKRHFSITNQIAIIAKHDTVWGQTPVMVIEKPTDGSEPDWTMPVFEKLADNLPAYHAPKEVYLTDKLPYLPTGKLDRLKLDAMLSDSTTTESCLTRVFPKLSKS